MSYTDILCAGDVRQQKTHHARRRSAHGSAHMISVFAAVDISPNRGTTRLRCELLFARCCVDESHASCALPVPTASISKLLCHAANESDDGYESDKAMKEAVVKAMKAMKATEKAQVDDEAAGAPMNKAMKVMEAMKAMKAM